MDSSRKTHTRQARLQRFFVALLVLCGFAIVLQTTSLLEASRNRLTASFRDIDIGLSWRRRNDGDTNEFPEPSADAGDTSEVSDEDSLHLSLLHEHCVSDASATLPWQFGSPGHQLANGTASNPEVVMHRDDKDLLQKLRQCPEVDIFLPSDLHGNGYCEDAVAYAKYLKSRLLPDWALSVKHFDPDLGREVDYFDLCPKTPMIFFNHYWQGVPSMPRWPKDKPVYLMPNIEMFELTAEHYWRVDAVLCKTTECFDRVTKWYEQEGNPRNASVFYTKHTSSDQAQFARKRLGEDAIAPKNFSDIKFIHTAGTSTGKGTQGLLQCWALVPGMPPLDVYIDNKVFDRLFGADFKKLIEVSRSPLKMHLGMVERSAFTKLTAEAAFFMCPSTREGYGHYINQARASGALVVVTDMSPMSELITKETGVLIPVTYRKHTKMLLGGAYSGKHGLKDVEGLIASFKGPDVCKAVLEMVKSTTTEQRAAMAAGARRAYHQDTKYFAKAMQELREFARRGN
ncbi:Homebox domain-containing protein [Phytophthora cinnamomi]|uniref:Homebox domain-containing protein n=1 Tax=Phytophthora cinnamomi TaxID=4785 RepID=UPI00355A4702|nr:Homebox domain-containing protein [Phytophthora cinnamomi]